MNKQTEIMGIKTGPTPEQQAEIDRVVKDFDEDWMIDVKKQQIRRKPRGFVQKVKEFFLPRRHNVFALYWWLKYEFHKKHRTDYMPFTFPVKHDNMPIPGYPMKYEIVGNWSIRKSDLKYLTKGPLARISPIEVLVPHSIGWERIVSWSKVWAAPLTVIAAILAIIVRSIQLASFVG